jgi:hypothetical protein
VSQSLAAFELERFTWDDGELEVAGRWSSDETRKFRRVRLLVEEDGKVRRIAPSRAAPLTASPAGAPWVAAFRWPGDHQRITRVELEVGRDLAVELPAPVRAERNGSTAHNGNGTAPARIGPSALAPKAPEPKVDDELDAERRRLEAHRRALDSERAALDATRRQVDQLRETARRSTRDAEGLRSRLEKERAAIDRERKEVTALRSELAADQQALEKGHAALERDRAALEKDRAALEKNRAALEKDRAALDATPPTEDPDATREWRNPDAIEHAHDEPAHDEPAHDEPALPSLRKVRRESARHPPTARHLASPRHHAGDKWTFRIAAAALAVPAAVAIAVMLDSLS